MSKPRRKNLVAVFEGHPPNNAMIDIANGLAGEATLENITKVRMGAKAHNGSSAWLVTPNAMAAVSPRVSSFAKTISPGISAPSLSASFGAKKSNVVYLASPRARNIMPAPSPRFLKAA